MKTQLSALIEVTSVQIFTPEKFSKKIEIKRFAQRTKLINNNAL